jgi:hypothetical protein
MELSEAVSRSSLDDSTSPCPASDIDSRVEWNPWYKSRGRAEYLNNKSEVDVSIDHFHRDNLVKISLRLNFTSYLVAAVFLLSFVLSIEAAPQEPSPAVAHPEAQTTKLQVDAAHRTEPEEPEISDREKRELEIRSEQTIGKVLAASDGSFFLYEWRRPYSWDKDFGTLPKSVPEHMQSWIYRVDPEISPTDSKYLFLYESGASQWLGSLSPDAKRVSFYSLDDDNKLKTGVWDFAKTKITWFTSAPDEKHLDQAPVWTSNAELIYPGHAGKYVRASVATGKAIFCADCKAIYEKSRTSLTPPAHGKVPEELGPDARILARSHLGQLSIYEKITPNLLALQFQKGTEKPETVFENSRLGSGPPPEAKN